MELNVLVMSWYFIRDKRGTNRGLVSGKVGESSPTTCMLVAFPDVPDSWHVPAVAQQWRHSGCC